MVSRRLRMLQMLLWFPAFLALVVVSLPAFAEASLEYGLQRTVYNYNQDGLNQYNNAPPLPSETLIEPTGISVVSRVEDNFDQYTPFGLYDDFVVRYIGNITAPVSGEISFWPQGDDGTKLYINNILVQDDWVDKGGGGAVSNPVSFTENTSFPFEFWFYENGGGAWVTLYWNIGNGWEIVPDSAFTISIVMPTTTTSSTTTTTTTSTTTTTVPYVETTTTSTLPETPQTTVGEVPSTTMPKEPLVQPTTTTTILKPVEVLPLPPPISVPSTSTSIPQNNGISDNRPITPQKAAAVASDPSVLNSISADDAQEVFSSIDTSQLTESEALAIVNAVQNAPEDIRQVFEDTVDLFSGNFDSYKMVGQTVSVGQRRTIVAVNLVTATIGATIASGGMPGPNQGGNSGPSGGTGDTNRSSRKEDEETEMAGEITGDGVSWISKLSIYKIIDGERVLDWKAFIKKFWFGIMNLGFTIAGSVVVYFTLSGKIQTIALVSTLMAFVSAMYLHMKEPE